MAVNRNSADEAAREYGKAEVVLRVLSYMKDMKGRVVLVVILMMAASLAVTALPALAGRAIDVDIASGDAAGLVRTVGAYALLTLVWWACYVARVRIMAGVSNKVVLRIRDEAFANVESLGLRYFDSRPTGKILSRLVGDVSSLNDMLKQLVTNVLPNVFFLAVIVAAMFSLNPTLALGAFTALPLITVTTGILFRIAHPRWMEFRAKQGNIAGYSHEAVSGIRVVQGCNAQEETTSAFEEINKNVEDTWTRAVRVGDFIGAAIEASQGIGYFCVFAAAIYLLKMDSSSVGELVAFTSYIGLFWQPVRAIANMYNQLGNNIAGAGRVFELIDEKPDIAEADDAEELPDVRGEVSFENVTFAYPDEPETLVLEDLSFSVKAGSKIALVGPTGAGKTTIVNLLCRFYDPRAGRVLIDGRDISKATFPSLRRQVCVMTQDSWLFSGTIAENIAYGRPDATRDRIEEVAKAVGADGFISKLPSGYDTQTADAGLSAGQKQLVALARTLLCDPRILILDEATSSVDTHTELLVQKGIAALTAGRTSFIVAHRLSTIRDADRIFVVRDRGIVEDGPHEELMAKGGFYRELHESQFGR